MSGRTLPPKYAYMTHFRHSAPPPKKKRGAKGTEFNTDRRLYHLTCDGVSLCDLLTHQVIYNASRTGHVAYSEQLDQDLCGPF